MRQARAFLDNIAQIRKKRVIAIRLVEAVVSVGPGGDYAGRAQSSQFLLNRAQGEAAHQREFADVALDFRVRKEQAQDCRTCFRKQQINNPGLRFHIILFLLPDKLDWLNQSSLICLAADAPNAFASRRRAEGGRDQKANAKQRMRGTNRSNPPALRIPE